MRYEKKNIICNFILYGNIDHVANEKASTYFVGRLIGLCTSNYTLKIAGTVATSTYRGSTAVGNYNSLSAANTGSSVDVTKKAGNIVIQYII